MSLPTPELPMRRELEEIAVSRVRGYLGVRRSICVAGTAKLLPGVARPPAAEIPTGKYFR